MKIMHNACYMYIASDLQHTYSSMFCYYGSFGRPGNPKQFQTWLLAVVFGTIISTILQCDPLINYYNGVCMHDIAI